VLTGLNPAIVSAHFLASMVMVSLSAYLLYGVGEGDDVPVALVLRARGRRPPGGAPDGKRPPTTTSLAFRLRAHVATGAVGYTQRLTGQPEVLVLVHMFGASLIAVTLTNGVLSLRSR
jgi:hypothetical protein